MTEQPEVVQEEVGGQIDNSQVPEVEVEQEPDKLESLGFSEEQLEYVIGVKTESDKLEAMHKADQDFIQKRNEDLGKARKVEQEYAQYRAEMEQLEQKESELNPYTDKDEYRETVAKQVDIGNKMSMHEKQLAEVEIKTYIPEYDELVAIFPDVLKEKGYDELGIKNIMATLSGNAQDAVIVSQWARDYKKIEEYKKTIETLSSSRGNVVNGIKSAAGRVPLTGGSSTRSTNTKITQDPYKMSSADRKALLDARIAKIKGG